MSTPLELGYRIPAEWEPHEATWISWPHNRADWPGKMATIDWVYAEIARKIVRGEKLRIIVKSDEHCRKAKRVLSKAELYPSSSGDIEFFVFPTNRSWVRDYGPFFLKKRIPPHDVVALRFGFNAWAKYPDWELDAEIPGLIARALGLSLVDSPHFSGRRFVLEGGAVEANGRGTLIVTEECLLDEKVQARNPGLSRCDVELVLRNYLGAEQVLWLGRGIAGDDTHGHVDDICRFVSPSTIVAVEEKNPSDPNYHPLKENIERLKGARLEDGSKPEIVILPMPEPIYFDGMRLPASYANFYISNSSVLVPTFNDPSDRVALGILSELFPTRRVVGIHSVDLVWGLGTIHCLTREQPLASY